MFLNLVGVCYYCYIKDLEFSIIFKCVGLLKTRYVVHIRIIIVECFELRLKTLESVLKLRVF